MAIISTKIIRYFIRRSVIEALQEILADSEYYLPLQKRVVRRLKKYSSLPAGSYKGTRLLNFKEKYL